jgi:hypothetical protein
VAEIEKLIKRKIEIEPLELEDERPRRPRRERDDDRRRSDDRREAAPPAPRTADPFFDRPYEPTGSEAPAWDAAKPAAPAPRPLSPNIRSKKKTAALLGGASG